MKANENQTPVERFWGEYLVLQDTETHKVKMITVKPGGRLSYQYHHKRSESWVVVKGVATVTLEDRTFDVYEGVSIYIPVEAKHRVENRQDVPLVFIEVQHGTYFGEDDIVRIEDDYGRV